MFSLPDGMWYYEMCLNNVSYCDLDWSITFANLRNYVITHYLLFLYYLEHWYAIALRSSANNATFEISIHHDMWHKNVSFALTCQLLVMQGNILYRFPSLQRTASSQRSKQKEYVGRRWTEWVGGIEKFFKERKWQFRFFIFPPIMR